MLPTPAYEAMVGALIRSIRVAPLDINPRAEGFDLCFASHDHIQVNIVLHLDGGDLRLPTDSYFVQTRDGDKYCLNMAASRPDGPAILGSFLQQNVHVKYNLATNLLSFTPTQCDTLP
ncbi:hypothetical protein L7F22_062419 [Adiantum nelumboides]|nr:hypothetical protein [Adiantum nelumboides]